MADSSTNSVMSSTPGFNYTGPGGAASPSAAGNPNAHIIDRRHAEWRTHQLRWRWLMDSYEGGEAYRQAIYGWDLTGLPVRNLIRHKREYPEPREQNYYGGLGRPPGSDMAAQATNDDYEMRRARTPVPCLLSRAIHRHVSKIHAQAPERNGPESLLQWYTDVDGSNTPINDWMRDTLDPLFLTHGQIDLIFERPTISKEDRAKIKTRADELEAGLDKVVISYILPENVVWWELGKRMGQYEKVLICEPQEQAGPGYRFWERDKWTLFDYDGNEIDTQPNPLGRIPILRLFDRRRLRAKNVGMPRYEEIAEIQRELYNRSSELVLSDSTQAHPLMMAPEDVLQADVTVPIGPGWMIPKPKTITENGVHYEPFEILEFPKGSSDSLRTNMADLRDQSDACALLTKPAGAAGTNGQTVGQSGISKRLDADDGNAYLGEVASSLAKAERLIAEMFLIVSNNGVINQADLDQVEICYPKDFDLYGPVELAGLIAEWQGVLATAGGTPSIEGSMLKRLMRLVLMGKSDEAYRAYDLEIDRYLQAAAIMRGETGELPVINIRRSKGEPDENVPGTKSSPDSVNSASLASAGVLVTEVY
jgi:hypothetical protein